MTHISSIGAAMYSDLSIHFGTNAKVDVTKPSDAYHTAALEANQWYSRFATESSTLVGANTFTRIPNIREFPAIGTTASISRVPLFGQKTSMSIQGQSDAPQLELQINYVPTEWASGTLLGDSVADQVTHAFRMTLLNEKPSYYSSMKRSVDSAVAEREIYFTNAGANLGVGDTLTQTTVTATVKAIYLHSGTLAAATNTGKMLITVPTGGSGTFAAGAATTDSGATTLTLVGPETVIESLGGSTNNPVGNSQYFWLGKVEALLIKPSLSDATTATLTLSIQSDFFGAYTTTSV